MTKYCECGREIRVCIRGHWGPPPDDSHDLCRKCWQSLVDSNRAT
jgi:hypothetical protein